MHTRLARVLLALALALPAASLADDDAEGCKDHPGVPRFPGYYISECQTHDFGAADFEVSGDKLEHKEGRSWHFSYTVNPGGKVPSPIEVARNYGNAAKKLGGKTLLSNVDGGGGLATLSMPVGKSERWLRVDLSNNGEMYVLDIVEVGGMEQKIEMDAAAMLDALKKDGFVALHGILFDTGKDTIKPESEGLLQEVAKLLTENGGLALSVEGHTDNVGKSKANLELSERRAVSVQTWLTGHGVPVARVTTRGWGDTKPVADNRTEDGRSKNRRVELVKRK